MLAVVQVIRIPWQEYVCYPGSDSGLWGSLETPFLDNPTLYLSHCFGLFRITFSKLRQYFTDEEMVTVQGGASQPNMDGYALPASQLPYAIPVETWPRTGHLPNHVTSTSGSLPNGAAYQQVRSHEDGDFLASLE